MRILTNKKLLSIIIRSHAYEIFKKERQRTLISGPPALDVEVTHLKTHDNHKSHCFHEKLDSTYIYIYDRLEESHRPKLILK